MLRPSRRIGTAELHKGAILSTLLDLLTAKAKGLHYYVNLRKNNTHLELAATKDEAHV